MPPSVVLDTNVVVSAHLKEDGWEAAVLLLSLAGQLTLCASEAVLDEYLRVLSRPKFRITSRRVQQSLHLIRAAARIVEPHQRLTVAPDEADNRFLECAQEARTDYLVTGNKRHFPKTFGKTKVVNARELIRTITPEIRQ